MTWGNNEFVEIMQDLPDILGPLYDEDEVQEYLQTLDFEYARDHDPEGAYQIWGYDPDGIYFDPCSGEQKDASPEEEIPFWRG